MKKSVPGISAFMIFILLFSFLNDAQLLAQDDTTHYVLPEFALGSVKMKNGRTEIALMDYNKLTEEMIFEKEGVRLALDSLEAIDTVSIESRIFIPHQKVFYELLVMGPVSLFMQHKCNLLAAGNPSGYGGTSETGASRSLSALASSGRAYKLKLPTEYHVTDDTQFWIRLNNSFYRSNTVSQVIKVFPEKEKEIKQYIKANRLDLKDTMDLVALIVKCNEFVR